MAAHYYSSSRNAVNLQPESPGLEIGIHDSGFAVLVDTGYPGRLPALEHEVEKILPFCGGMKVVYSPGHTIGHICLYFARSRLLVAGDALSCKDGVLDRTPSRNQYDMERYEESLRSAENS